MDDLAFYFFATASILLLVIITFMIIKCCFVPGCSNNSERDPNKIYVTVPKDEETRANWFQAVAPEQNIRKTGNLYACEDHFDLPSDTENWMYYKTMGQRLRMKKGSVPQMKTTAECHMTDSAKKRKQENIEMFENSRTRRKLEFEPQPSTSTFINITPTKSELSESPSYHICSPSGSFYVDEMISSPITDGQKFKNQKTQTYLSKTSHFRSVSTMAKVKTSTKSTMCVPEHFQIAMKSSSVCSSPSISATTSTIYSPTTVTCSGSSAASLNSKLNADIKESLRKETFNKIENHSRFYLGIPKEEYFLIKFTENELQINYMKILITLKKIRTNDPYLRLSIDFYLSTSTVCNYFISTLPQIASLYQNLIFWPEKWIVRRLLPTPFRYRYSNTQSIIDCFEIQIEVPSNPTYQAVTWSQYKKCNTIKYLISCTPYGFVNFISEGYGGRISDFDIVERSGYLDDLVENTAVMADRGFKNIASQLQRKNCTLIRPPSVSAETVSTRKEVLESKRIASLRIHVERVIRRLREFEMLAPHACININTVKWLDSITIIACAVINMQGLLIKS